MKTPCRTSPVASLTSRRADVTGGATAARTASDERRPRLERPRAELAVGEARRAPIAGVGVDPQERAGAAEVAERAGRVAAARSSGGAWRRAARSRGPSRAAGTGRRPGSTPPRPGNCTVVASASVAGATSVGASSSAAKRGEVGHRAAQLVGGRAAAASTPSWPSGLEHGLVEVGRRSGMAARGLDVTGEQLDAGVRVDAAPAGRRRSALRRRSRSRRRGRGGGARWRRAGRPGRRGRSVPSSTATSAA